MPCRWELGGHRTGAEPSREGWQRSCWRWRLWFRILHSLAGIHSFSPCPQVSGQRGSKSLGQSWQESLGTYYSGSLPSRSHSNAAVPRLSLKARRADPMKSCPSGRLARLPEALSPFMMAVASRGQASCSHPACAGRGSRLDPGEKMPQTEMRNRKPFY